MWTGRRTSCLNHITQHRHVTQPRIQKGSPMCVIPTDWMFENELLMNSQVSLLLVFTERKHLSTQISWNKKKKKASLCTRAKRNFRNWQLKKQKQNKDRKQTKVLAINYIYTHILTHTHNYIYNYKTDFKIWSVPNCFLHNPLLCFLVCLQFYF